MNTTTTRRGPYGARQERPALLDLDEITRLRERFIAESRLEGEAGKEALAETLATQIVRQRYLLDLEAAGKLSSEEARSMPGLASGIRRLVADLRLASPVEDEDDGFPTI